MTYVPDSWMLRGTPLAVAECYGKPHFLCDYTANGVNNTRIFQDAPCICCGRQATNAHHWPPKRTCPTFGFHGEKLRPALFAVCGSGTTGCHDGWHGGARFRALWKWDYDEFAMQWWEGSMLEEHGAHSNALYQFGCWELYDFVNGKIWEVRL